MKTTIKIGLLLIFGLILAIIAYSIYAFVEFIWFLLPTGILLAAMFLAPILQASPLKLTKDQKQLLVQKDKSQKYFLLKTIWIFWSLIASIFITFFNGFTGNIVWCSLTLILLFIEIHTKKKQLAVKNLKT